MKAVGNHHGIRFNQVFLDEVLTGMDDSLKNKAHRLLTTLSAEYDSIFVVEHSNEFKELFTKITKRPVKLKLPSRPPKPKLLRERLEYTKNLKWKHEFECWCGKTFIAIGADVVSGRTKSCGCCNHFVSRIINSKHNLNKTSEHRAWVEMKRRCYDSTRPAYPDYGGRGIKVCARWLESFNNFIADMGTKVDPYTSLDRIDPDKNYEPDNCRWASKTVQNQNQRRHKGKVFHAKTK